MSGTARPRAPEGSGPRPGPSLAVRIGLGALLLLAGGLAALLLALAMFHRPVILCTGFVLAILAGGGFGALGRARSAWFGLLWAAPLPVAAGLLGPGSAPPASFYSYYLLGALGLALGYLAGRAAGRGAGIPGLWLGLVGLILAVPLAKGIADPPSLPDPPAGRSTLFVGPVFVTGDAEVPEARAVLVDGAGRVVRLYDGRSQDTSGVPVVNLPGALALPGLTDAHLHLDLLAEQLWGIDLHGVRSRAELHDRVARFIADHPDRSAYTGGGWDQELFADKVYPTAADLDGLTDKPIALYRVDVHTVVVNSALLNLAGVRRTMPEPPGGHILRDSLGVPTGAFVDDAVAPVLAFLPPPTPRERQAMLSLALEAAAEAGLTAVHDMAMDTASLSALRALDALQPLPVRIFAYLRGDRLLWVIADRLRQPWRSAAGARRDGRVEVMGIKLVIDGTMGSRTALLSEPYSDDPGHRGAPAFELSLQHKAYRLAEWLDYQVAIHAIGDSANGIALDWVEQGHRTTLPTRIEHAQLLRPSDVRRFGSPRIATSMQPIHLVTDLPWIDARVGALRAPDAYPWRALQDAGALLQFGSDAPTAPIDPLRGIEAALTRQDSLGQPPGGWHPEQRMEWKDVLPAYTSHPAQVVGHTGQLGGLSPGKRFDLTVLADDCRTDPTCWAHTRPTLVVVGGVVRALRGPTPAP